MPPPYSGQWPGEPGQPGWPTHPLPGQRRRLRWRFIAGGAAALLIVIGGIIAALPGGGEAVRGADPDTGAVSGDRGQWTAALRAEDSDLATSSNFLYPDATNIAYCATKPSGTTPAQPVVIGEWPRDADIEADLTRLGSVHWFAAATVGDRTTVFVLLDSPEPELLGPLTTFGFAITPLD